MPDLALPWGGDLELTASGDLAMVDGADLTAQRIIRRLYTAAHAYLWHPSYGAGLPQRIGRVAQTRAIQALVRSQIALESTVAKVPVPIITVTDSTVVSGLFVIEIKYADAVTGAAQDINFTVPSRT